MRYSSAEYVCVLWEGWSEGDSLYKVPYFLSLSLSLSSSLPHYVKNTKLTWQINSSRWKQHQFREERKDKRKEEGGNRRHPFRISSVLNEIESIFNLVHHYSKMPGISQPILQHCTLLQFRCNYTFWKPNLYACVYVAEYVFIKWIC